jgi:hypothetical protein
MAWGALLSLKWWAIPYLLIGYGISERIERSEQPADRGYDGGRLLVKVLLITCWGALLVGGSVLCLPRLPWDWNFEVERRRADRPARRHFSWVFNREW